MSGRLECTDPVFLNEELGKTSGTYFMLVVVYLYNNAREWYPMPSSHNII